MTRDEFEAHFRREFSDLIGHRVLVALSGGPDSVALLHLLSSPLLALELEAAHVHHGVRGAEADRDASFCHRLCAELAIPFHLLRIDPNAPLDSGRESAWRRLRYQALLELKTARGLDAVATGHQRDDVAEGVLVQLLRGGGPRALAGIAKTTAAGVIRPLLPWGRAEVLDWLQERGAAWCEDSSNRDPQHLRNRVRHLLLPQLETASPGLRGHLVHLAETLARDEQAFADELTSRALWIDPWEPDGGVSEIAIGKLGASLRLRWLHAQAARVGLGRVTRRQGELFESLLATGEPRAVTLAGRWRLRLARGRLWLEPPGTPEAFAFNLIEDSCFDLPMPGWHVRFVTCGDRPEGLRWSFHPPQRAAGLKIRSTGENDQIHDGGDLVPARKMLAKKIPRHLRATWPVCCDNDRILWIPGVWRCPDVPSRARHVVEVMRRGRPSCAV